MQTEDCYKYPFGFTGPLHQMQDDSVESHKAPRKSGRVNTDRGVADRGVREKRLVASVYPSTPGVGDGRTNNVEDVYMDKTSIRPDVWGSAVASGDAVQLSKMVLEWSASKHEVALSLLRKCFAVLEEDLAYCAGHRPPPSSSSRPYGFVQNPCLDAFAVVLNQSCGGSDWFSSTKELQLASLEFCAACRNVATMTLRVDDAIPRRLLAAADAPAPGGRRLCSTRVPRLRARRVLWNLPTAVELRRTLHALTDAIDIEFDCDCVETLEGIEWPHRLHALTINCYSVSIQRLVATVLWPASLRQLTFGHYFSQPIEGMMFPKSLQQLTFGDSFNQTIEKVMWPASLRQLIFGFYFDQPVERVVWPTSLQQLTFDKYFNQPIEEVVWPVCLQQLIFGNTFDQPIEKAVWPPSLQQLIFGGSFDQPIEAGTWPDSFRKVSFGQDFNQPIAEVRWPTLLEDLSFMRTDSMFWILRESGDLIGTTFDQAICGARWSRSLRRLSLGGKFSCSCRHLGVWMPSLEELTLLLDDPSAYGPLLHGIEWPRRLRKVTLFDDASLDGVTIPRDVQVVRLTRYRELSSLYPG